MAALGSGAQPEPFAVAGEMLCSDWPVLRPVPAAEGPKDRPGTGIRSGGGVASPKEMLDVVTRREKDDEQAKITDVYLPPQPRLD